MRLVETKDGTIIEAFVKPRQPRFKIALEGNEIIICSTEEPIRGKVNKEIIKELTKLFHTEVKLVAGPTSKQKHFLVKERKKQEIENLLRIT
jgi:uncharacterized protein (TIGR00251 family)